MGDYSDHDGRRPEPPYQTDKDEEIASLYDQMADKDARIAALEKCVEAAEKIRLFRPPTLPSDLRNGAIMNEWRQCCAAFDTARAALGKETG